MTKVVKSDIYKTQELKNTWSFNMYEKYKNASSTWNWSCLPFGKHRESRGMWTKVPPKTSGSILEIGSAGGGAYEFMKNSGIIDLSDYTGLEISQMGHEYSKKKYPSAKWKQVDVTQYKLNQNYDYIFERIAIHHMPNPLSIIDRFSKKTNKAFSTHFVSCLNGYTISDLSIARYRHPNGDFVFFDIINVFEVIEILYQNGFNRISLFHGPLHEKVDHDPLALQYISPEIDMKKRFMGRCYVFATKSEDHSSLRISPFFARSLFFNKKLINLVNDRTKRMCEQRNGVLYAGDKSFAGEKW